VRIAIAGASGTIGTLIQGAALTAGHEIMSLSRKYGVDLTRAEALAGRMRGVDAVIDVTSTGTLSTAASVRFFTTVTRNLLTAEREAQVPHHIALSIIGAARADSGHYGGKAAQEGVVMRSGAGWSLLRTSQFHELARQTADRGSILGVHLAPAMRCQPIAAAEVAAELIRIAGQGPGGLQPELAGPREEDIPDLVRRYLAATGQSRRVLRVPLPGAMGAAMRSGGILPAPGTRLGHQTFQQWLDSIAPH
jgi:uncharacterized protein YbjT (DUF2867 family)